MALRRAEVLGFKHQIFDQRLVLDVRLVLPRTPDLALVRGHVLAIVRGAGELHVVSDHHRTPVQPSTTDDPLQIRQVEVLVVVDEDEVERAECEAVLSLESGDGRAVVG